MTPFLFKMNTDGTGRRWWFSPDVSSRSIPNPLYFLTVASSTLNAIPKACAAKSLLSDNKR